MASGTCSVHSWNEGTQDDDDPELNLGRRVNHKLEPETQTRTNINRRAAARRQGLRSQAVNRQEEDDEDARGW